MSLMNFSYNLILTKYTHTDPHNEHQFINLLSETLFSFQKHFSSTLRLRGLSRVASICLFRGKHTVVWLTEPGQSILSVTLIGSEIIRWPKSD